jgi:S1-C subfamily serine protease
MQEPQARRQPDSTLGTKSFDSDMVEAARTLPPAARQWRGQKPSKGVVVELTSFDALGQPLIIGTGFFINRTDVLTNYHVIKGASQFRILTYDGNEVANGTLYTWSNEWALRYSVWLSC